MNAGRAYCSGAGTQTAGLSTGGQSSSEPSGSNDVEHYNGSTWSIGGDLNIGVFYLTTSGLQTSALKYGGRISAVSYATTESYDGTAWQIEEDMPIISCTNASVGNSSSNSLCISGEGLWQTIRVFETQEYNGSWSIGNNVNIQCFANGCGTTERALKFGGNYATNNATNRTESFSGTNLNEISITGKTKLTFLVA